MSQVKLRPYDVVNYLRDDEDMVAYLEEALEAVQDDDDPRLLAMALGNIARAKGMSALARDTGLSRESLYKALSAEGNPQFATVLKVVRALGFKLHASVA